MKSDSNGGVVEAKVGLPGEIEGAHLALACGKEVEFVGIAYVMHFKDLGHILKGLRAIADSDIACDVLLVAMLDGVHEIAYDLGIVCAVWIQGHAVKKDAWRRRHRRQSGPPAPIVWEVGGLCLWCFRRSFSFCFKGKEEGGGVGWRQEQGVVCRGGERPCVGIERHGLCVWSARLEGLRVLYKIFWTKIDWCVCV
jgi:hypothetical protein